jgi:hypothetical protein
MDAFLQVLLAWTPIFGFEVQNWMLAFGGFFALWLLYELVMSPFKKLK